MITARSRTALDERPLSVMVEWCGAHLPTLMGFAAWAREAALRSLGAPAPTRGGVRRQAGGRRRGATRTGETEEGDAQMLSRGEERVRRGVAALVATNRQNQG